MTQPHRPEHSRGYSYGCCHHRRAYEHSLNKRAVPDVDDRETHSEWQNDAENGRQGGSHADIEKVAGSCFQADSKQQKDYTCLGKDRDDFGRLDPTYNGRSDRYAGPALADDSRLTKPLKELSHQFCRRQDHKKRQDDIQVIDRGGNNYRHRINVFGHDLGAIITIKPGSVEMAR
ncbi:MAG: hypothetical protein ABI539_12645 [Acidobacteriota bacterium]